MSDNDTGCNTCTHRDDCAMRPEVEALKFTIAEVGYEKAKPSILEFMNRHIWTNKEDAVMAFQYIFTMVGPENLLDVAKILHARFGDVMQIVADEVFQRRVRIIMKKAVTQLQMMGRDMGVNVKLVISVHPLPGTATRADIDRVVQVVGSAIESLKPEDKPVFSSVTLH